MEPRDRGARTGTAGAERLAEVTALFRYLDVRGTGHLSARDLKRWAAALVADGSEAASRLLTPSPALPSSANQLTRRRCRCQPRRVYGARDGV